MTHVNSPALFLTFEETAFLTNICVRDASESIDHTHVKHSLSMRLRNTLNPDDEQMCQNERSDNDR